MTIYDHTAAQSLLVSGEGKQNGQVGEGVTLPPATPSVVWAPGRRRLLPQEAGAPQDWGICWHRVGLGGRRAAALCSVRKLYSYCKKRNRGSQARGP